jgi:S-methylmethionine-dependent homocysteine/selenocysteine methylase
LSAGALGRALGNNRVLLLDAAMGTELQRRGFATDLPLWSARALLEHPDAVLQIHRDYVSAGADVITTNTFRTTGRTFRRAGLTDRSAALTAHAVSLARAASGSAAPRRVLVAGSIAPLEDCYRPDLVPPDDVLALEHTELAGRLAANGVDLILLETFGTIRETVAACRAAIGTGLDVVVSFLCRPDGVLYGGEDLPSAVRTIERLGPAAVSVNCISPRHADAILQALVTSTSLPCAIYANVGFPGEERTGAFRRDLRPGEYAAHATRWLALGASIIGGCCGTTAADLRELRAVIDAHMARSGITP